MLSCNKNDFTRCNKQVIKEIKYDKEQEKPDIFNDNYNNNNIRKHWM